MSQDLNKVIFPVIRKVVPNLIAQQIIGVQPMTNPYGLSEQEQNFRLLERVIPSMTSYRRIKSWFNETKYYIAVLVANKEQLETIRKAGFGDWIDNEDFFNLARTFLRLQYELADASERKYEGMSRDDVDQLMQAIDKAYEDYEFMRRLIDADNKMIWLLQTVYS